jgi:RP/EB family microtubule-associated protein
MGMMSGCYFVGRAELLEWINELLGINYDKVEDVANGAAFCQVIDAIHPGSVALARVNFNAVTEAEMVENYKILQDAFSRNGITQYLDVATLCKGKYMAALELFQWTHDYYEQLGGTPGYHGPGRRRQRKCKDLTERGWRAINRRGWRGGIPMGSPPVEDNSRPTAGRGLLPRERGATGRAAGVGDPV